jgi:hypothetical protein
MEQKHGEPRLAARQTVSEILGHVNRASVADDGKAGHVVVGIE